MSREYSGCAVSFVLASVFFVLAMVVFVLVVF